MVRISQLAIYPVKSCAQISLATAQLDHFGLHLDRRWMVVDEYGKYLSQRELPRLCLIKPALVENGIILQAPEMEHCQLEVNNLTEKHSVIIWEDQCNALDCGNRAAEWLSLFLSKQVRLVYFPDSERRQVDLDYARQGEQTAFSDGFPLLLISEASLADLNERLENSRQQRVEMRRFRPNIVVTGCDAFAEDNWRRIRIGETVLRVVKPCSRCVIPGIDPDTGILGNEPLQTLKKYRRQDHPQIGKKIFFGQNVIAENIGEFKVGMSVDIIEWQN